MICSTPFLYWMVPIVVLLLTNAATNAWDLMLGLARYKLPPVANGDTSAVAPSHEQGENSSQEHAR